MIVKLTPLKKMECISRELQVQGKRYLECILHIPGRSVLLCYPSCFVYVPTWQEWIQVAQSSMFVVKELPTKFPLEN